MSDDRLRALERQWRENPDPDVASALVAAALRARPDGFDLEPYCASLLEGGLPELAVNVALDAYAPFRLARVRRLEAIGWGRARVSLDGIPIEWGVVGPRGIHIGRLSMALNRDPYPREQKPPPGPWQGRFCLARCTIFETPNQKIHDWRFAPVPGFIQGRPPSA